jgi:hypothetical protein
MGGLGLHNLATEQGISQIMTFLSQVYKRSELGKLLIITVNNFQLEAGISSQLLRDPTQYIPHLTEGWLVSLRNFLCSHQISLQLTKEWNFYLPRRNDLFLMDVFVRSNLYSDKEIKTLNYVRLYLQVATLSDVGSARGESITQEAYAGIKSTSRVSKWSWPRHDHLTPTQLRLWQSALERHFWSQVQRTVLRDRFESKSLWDNGYNLQIRYGSFTLTQSQTL